MEHSGALGGAQAPLTVNVPVGVALSRYARRVLPTARPAALVFFIGILACPAAWADPPEDEKAPKTGESGESADDAPAEEPVVPTSTLVRGLSWDMMGGGVPAAGALAEVQFGFSSLVRAGYHYTLRPGFSVGGLVAFDYAYYRPAAVWTSSLVLAAPVRYTLFRKETVSAAIRAEPGVRLVFEDIFAFGLLANVSGVFAWTLQNRFIVGAIVDIPLAFTIPEQGTVDLAIPLLFGAVAEFHLSPPLAVTFEAKVGPAISTAGETRFGMELVAGAAYRL